MKFNVYFVRLCIIIIFVKYVGRWLKHTETRQNKETVYGSGEEGQTCVDEKT